MWGAAARARDKVTRSAAGPASLRRALAAEPGVAGEINPHHLCAKLVKALGPSGVVINEAIEGVKRFGASGRATTPMAPADTAAGMKSSPLNRAPLNAPKMDGERSKPQRRKRSEFWTA